MYNRTLLASVAILLALTGAPAAFAQTAGHEQHHPATGAAPAPDTSAQPAPGASPAAPQAAAPGSPGGMMQGGCGMMMGGRGGMGMMQGHGMPGQQGGGGMMGGHGMGMMDHGMMGQMAQEPTDPLEAGFAAINRRMHKDMAATTPGDPDRMFAQAMVAHHQGAVDMAKLALAFGTDPQIRSLAEQVIKAQEQEITVLQQWLATHSQR